MKATELIATALESGRMWLEALVGDLEGADMTTQPTSKGGNHPAWVIGHLVVAEHGIVTSYIKGDKPAAPAGWDALFGMGSQPVADAAKYPTKAELLTAFRAARADTLKHLQTLSDADLDKPTNAEHKDLFGTAGKCFAVLIGHQTFHAGQIADTRRTLGRKPVFA